MIWMMKRWQTTKKDALQFVKEWDGERFDTVLLDPPYAYRKSMEMYKGIKASPFRQLKDELPRILKPNGIVITFGYHSNTMGKNRGFEVERISTIFSWRGYTRYYRKCGEALQVTFCSYAQPCVAPAARLRIGAVMP